MTRKKIIDEIMGEYQQLIRKKHSKLDPANQRQKNQHLQEIEAELNKDEIDQQFSNLYCPAFIEMCGPQIKHELFCIASNVCDKNGIKFSELEKIK